MQNKKVVKSEQMLKAERIMESIVQRLNRDGMTAATLAEEFGMSTSNITALTGFMRKQGIEVPFARKGSFYKSIIQQWKKEKPELFTTYGLKPRR